MLRTPVLLASLVFAALSLCLLSGARAVSSGRLPAQVSSQPPARRDVGRVAGLAVDLGGTYVGRVESSDPAISGDARLRITGDRFRLEVDDGQDYHGTLSATRTGDDTAAVSLSFGTAGAPPGLALSARFDSGWLRLTSAPGEPRRFSFTPRSRGFWSMAKKGRVRRATKDSNTAYETESDMETRGNTATNANTSTTTNRATPTNAGGGIVGGAGGSAGTSSANAGPVFAATPAPQTTTVAPLPSMNVPTATTGGPSATPRGRSVGFDPKAGGAAVVRHDGTQGASGSPSATPPATATGAQPAGAGGPPAGSGGQSSIAHIINSLTEGRLALDAPDRMRQGVPRTVVARVAFEDIGAAIGDGLRDAGRPETIKVAEEMKVTLTAAEKDAFIIVPKTEEKKIIVGLPYAEWRWEVTPRVSGKQTLHLSAIAVVTVGGSDKVFEVPTKGKDIEVQVSYGYIVKGFISDNSSVLFGGLSIPCVIGFMWKGYQWWKKRAAQSQPSAT